MKTQINLIATIHTITLTSVIALLLNGCGPLPEEESNSQKEFDELVQDHENKQTLKELSYNWSLNEIDDEIFDCQTKEYNQRERSKVEDFCTCKVQMLARRWEYIEYKHYSFSYDKALKDSGRLDICSGSEGSDTLEAIKTDSTFKADETTESEAMESGESQTLSNEDGSILVSDTHVMITGDLTDQGTISWLRSKVITDCQAEEFYYTEVCDFLSENDLLD